MQRIDEEFCAGLILEVTQLSIGELSMLKSIDTKFVRKSFLVLMCSLASCKVPDECISKPLLTKVLKQRVSHLGNLFATNQLSDVACKGRINWYHVGLYRVEFASDYATVSKVCWLYDDSIKADVSDEGITHDFDVDMAWSPRCSAFVYKSRRHEIWNMFTKGQQKAMQMWNGQPEQLKTAVKITIEEMAEVAPKTTEVAMSDLRKDTQEKRNKAVEEARNRLKDSKAEAATKRRRISLKEAGVKSSTAMKHEVAKKK